MNTNPTPPTGKSTDMQRVACQICQKEVPKSEAKVSEATDYIMYFCGLDCYERWKSESAKPNDAGERSA